MSAQRWLAHEDFLAAHPYYAAVLARLDALEDASITRIALGRAERRIYLLVPIATLETEIEKALLMHAVHHVVMGHLSHPKFASPAHPELMQLAMEITANEHVPYVLPCGPVWKDFDAIGMRARQSTIARYEILCAARRSGELPSTGDIEPTCNPDPPSGGGIGDSARDDAALAHARSIVSDAIGSITVPPPGRAGQLAGSNPGHVLELLSLEARSPRTRLDWKSALSTFLSRVRAPVHTYSRPSRRFPGRIGEVPGRMWAPQKGIRPKIACAIDTSASLSKQELEEIALHLESVGAFADVTVIECDVRIQRIYRFEGRLTSVRGRGGTDLRPPFARDILDRFGPDGIVYFTDGLGPAPVRDPGVPTLWVLTRDGSFRCPWGARAYV
jgi:predicted metal-dependent peptidase